MMQDVYHIETISELNHFLSQDKARHPLVSVIDFTGVASHGKENIKITSGFYSVMFKSSCNGQFKYGRKHFDFQEGTLICIAPHQVAMVENEEGIQDNMAGWGLFFHPDLLKGTSLANKMKTYSYFSYDANEALHLSDAEKQTLQECSLKIERELLHPIDKHSKTLIVSNIELLLNYCLRYYDRQFITRSDNNKDLLARFEQVLQDYFRLDKLKSQGLPTVKYCAEKMFLSANYLSDLLKKETGKNAQEHIHHYLIEEVKIHLTSSTASVGEIAYELGFEYPHYLSKLFKTKTGLTPSAYRQAQEQ